MLLRINQDVRTTTIVVWKDGAYPILENAMLQKKKKKVFKDLSVFDFKDFC